GVSGDREGLDPADERRRGPVEDAVQKAEVAPADAARRAAGPAVADRVGAGLIDEGDVGPAGDGRDRAGRAQLAGHHLERDAGVLLGLDAVRAEEVGLLSPSLDDEDASHHDTHHRRHHQQLRQGEAALVPELMPHGGHLLAMYMVTTADLVVPAGATPIP